ncbi:unnamed protein product [Schistosoma mattheei]|uniref:Uncharacterized protein n=1 Tax=Schistosoma mattheei TaxID=31246 RepID=A0A3P8GT54_9TREM|nr:unnamed protein product [Schistosoma mattheei]
MKHYANISPVVIPKASISHLEKCLSIKDISLINNNNNNNNKSNQSDSQTPTLKGSNTSLTAIDDIESTHSMHTLDLSDSDSDSSDLSSNDASGSHGSDHKEQKRKVCTLLIDWIIKTSTSEGKHGIQWMARIQLGDLDFTDDLALLSHTQQQKQKKTTSVAAVSSAVGLNIHKGKSKILRYSTTCTNPIIIDGKDLQDVKAVTYLVRIIDEHSGSDADVKARIGKARAAYLQLKNI